MVLISKIWAERSDLEKDCVSANRRVVSDEQKVGCGLVNKLGNDTGLSMDTTVPRCTTTMFRLVDPVTMGEMPRE